MKKLIYFIFGLVLITAISCKKEIIQPNNVIDNQIDNNNKRDSDQGTDESTNPKNSNPIEFYNSKTTFEPNDSINVITDPNRDDDDIKKPKD